MKVKMKKCFIKYSCLTEGAEYEVMVSMSCINGGTWAEILNDMGIKSLIKIPSCVFGEWEVVNED